MKENQKTPTNCAMIWENSVVLKTFTRFVYYFVVIMMFMFHWTYIRINRTLTVFENPSNQFRPISPFVSISFFTVYRYWNLPSPGSFASTFYGYKLCQSVFRKRTNSIMWNEDWACVGVSNISSGVCGLREFKMCLQEVVHDMSSGKSLIYCSEVFCCRRDQESWNLNEIHLGCHKHFWSMCTRTCIWWIASVVQSWGSTNKNRIVLFNEYGFLGKASKNFPDVLMSIPVPNMPYPIYCTKNWKVILTILLHGNSSMNLNLIGPHIMIQIVYLIVNRVRTEVIILFVRRKRRPLWETIYSRRRRSRRSVSPLERTNPSTHDGGKYSDDDDNKKRRCIFQCKHRVWIEERAK